MKKWFLLSRQTNEERVSQVADFVFYYNSLNRLANFAQAQELVSAFLSYSLLYKVDRYKVNKQKVNSLQKAGGNLRFLNAGVSCIPSS